MFKPSVKTFILLSAVTALFFTACRKRDWTTVPDGRNKCELLSVSSTAVDPERLRDLPLFTKSFVPGTYKLNSFFYYVREPHGGPSYPEPAASFAVTYEGSKMIVTRNTYERFEIYFDNNGRVVKAINNEFGLDWEYRFVIHGGRLKQIIKEVIDYGFPPDTIYTVSYDAAKKNVLQERIGGYTTVNYSFGTQKVKGQLLADQRYWDYDSFIGVIKYLNLFPELQSEKLVTGSSTVTSLHPNSFTTVYSDHVIDGGGRVTSFRATSNYTEVDPWFDPAIFNESAVWNFTWSCLK